MNSNDVKLKILEQPQGAHVRLSAEEMSALGERCYSTMLGTQGMFEGRLFYCPDLPVKEAA